MEDSKIRALLAASKTEPVRPEGFVGPEPVFGILKHLDEAIDGVDRNGVQGFKALADSVPTEPIRNNLDRALQMRSDIKSIIRDDIKQASEGLMQSGVNIGNIFAYMPSNETGYEESGLNPENIFHIEEIAHPEDFILKLLHTPEAVLNEVDLRALHRQASEAWA